MDGTEGLAMTTFEPGAEARRAFRDALGRFGTGVTVVTAAAETGPCGITANSFASVSLDPALVLWSVDKGSDRFPVFNAAQHTAIHVLRSDQADLARQFTKGGRDFAGIDWAPGDGGAPLITGCLTRFECDLVANHDGGDHRILVSRVTRVTLGEGAPLLFAHGRFGSFVRED